MVKQTKGRMALLSLLLRLAWFARAPSPPRGDKQRRTATAPRQPARRRPSAQADEFSIRWKPPRPHNLKTLTDENFPAWQEITCTGNSGGKDGRNA
jgi:hypothetical protein